MLFDAVLGIETNHESREPKLNRQIWNQLNTDMQDIAANIENLVQVRLHYPEA
jgi:hypothetical protein